MARGDKKKGREDKKPKQADSLKKLGKSAYSQSLTQAAGTQPLLKTRNK